VGFWGEILKTISIDFSMQFFRTEGTCSTFQVQSTPHEHNRLRKSGRRKTRRFLKNPVCGPSIPYILGWSNHIQFDFLFSVHLCNSARFFGGT
jgi:hypothetical protein